MFVLLFSLCKFRIRVRMFIMMVGCVWMLPFHRPAFRLSKNMRSLCRWIASSLSIVPHSQLNENSETTNGKTQTHSQPKASRSEYNILLNKVKMNYLILSAKSIIWGTAIWLRLLYAERFTFLNLLDSFNEIALFCDRSPSYSIIIIIIIVAASPLAARRLMRPPPARHCFWSWTQIILFITAAAAAAAFEALS